MIGWAILGGGEFADRGMGPALARAADTRFAAVWCRSMEKARAFADKHKAENAYDSIGKMLADPGVDAVYVATPNSLHAEHAIAAARAGKHVLIEKPMANTVRDAEAIVEACERAGVTLGVVFQNRYHSAHVAARARVASGALGAIDLATAQLCRGFQRGTHWSGWRVDPAMMGSGAIVAQAVHPIDLLRFVLGAEVTEVQAMTDEKPPDMPLEEMSYSLLRFSNGTHGIVVAGTLLPRFDNDLVLYGATSKVRCNATLGMPRAGARAEMIVQDEGREERVELAPDDSNPAKLARLLDDFAKAVRERTQPMLSGHNGVQMVRVAIALQQASRERRAIRIA